MTKQFKQFCPPGSISYIYSPATYAAMEMKLVIGRALLYTLSVNKDVEQQSQVFKPTLSKSEARDAVAVIQMGI